MAKTVFQLDIEPSFFECIVARPCGTLLATRQDVNELWEVNPVQGVGKCIATIPGVESLTGFTEISWDVYAVGAGTYRLKNHEGTVPGTYSLWVIDLTGTGPRVRLVALIPSIGQLNGLATWDAQTVLAADSYHGKIYRINLADGTSSIQFEDDTMKDPPNSPIRMGVNGIKVRRRNTNYIYYTNTTRLLFCRFPVNNRLESNGQAEILVSGFIPEDEAVGTAFEGVASAPTANMVPWFMPDDFCFDQDGVAFVTTHPTNMVFRVSPNGDAARISGGLSSWEVAAATSCTFGRSASDRNVLYISTAGANVIPIEGKTEAAKVVAIRIKE